MILFANKQNNKIKEIKKIMLDFIEQVYYNISIKRKGKNMEQKLLKRKVEFLKDFLNIRLVKQNEYIKINDVKEIEDNNKIIMKVLIDIAKLEKELVL